MDTSAAPALFGGFPRDLSWSWVALAPAELLAVRYIDYSYWVELSGGSRLPTDAARRVREGVEPFGVSGDGFFELAAELRAGAKVEPLIVVSAAEEGGDMVLEGHGRLTGFALAPEVLPAEVEVLRGVSADVAEWWAY